MTIERLKTENDALNILNSELKLKVKDLEDQVKLLQNNSVNLLEKLVLIIKDEQSITH